MTIVETPRLRLRHLTTADAPFILSLLNEPSFIRNVGDRGVRTLDDAVAYLERGPLASYERHGFGLFLVELKGAATPIGVCGILKRDELADVDIGFSLLPDYWSRGFGREAATAVQEYAKRTLGLRRMVAITSPDNDASAKLLGKLGFRFERMIEFGPSKEALRLFSAALSFLVMLAFVAPQARERTRAHANGITNQHIKFPDGTELEKPIARGSSVFLAPAITHGLWLELREVRRPDH